MIGMQFDSKWWMKQYSVIFDGNRYEVSYTYNWLPCVRHRVGVFQTMDGAVLACLNMRKKKWTAS